MNDFIKEQQHRVGTSTDRIFSRLEDVAKVANSYRAQVEKIRNEKMYSQEGREKLVNRAGEDYRANILPLCNQIQSEAETIRDALRNMSQTVDFGADLQNALNVVKLGKELPVSVRTSLLEPFRGQPWALSVLQGAYQQAEIAHEQYFSGLTFNESSVDELDTLTQQVLGSKPGDTVPCYRLAKAAGKLAQCVGADNQRQAADLQGMERSLSDAIAEACGLTR